MEMPPPDCNLQAENSGDLVWYRPSDGPGPVFRVAADGTLTVYKLGVTNQDMAKLFWEAVMFQGTNYTQKLQVCEQMLTTLNHDPTRQIVSEGQYEVFQVLKAEKAGVSFAAVQKVMDAIKTLCQRETN